METEWVVESPTIVDRSTLDAFVRYPYRARMVSTLGLVESSEPMEVGIAVHDCLASMTALHIEAGGLMATELANRLEGGLAAINPALSNEINAAMRATTWAWSRYMSVLPPSAIMRHDGGEGDRSGQMAFEVNGVLVTSEVDLMLATAAPEYVKVIDYKTGWGLWDEDDIESSFQFQLHAFLILANYPEVEQVGVAVWNTRVNRLTKFVRFSRENLNAYFRRVEAAVDHWKACQGMATDDLPCHPADEHCPTCPVLMQCRLAREEHKATPAELLKRLFILQQQEEVVTKLLKVHVEAGGCDVEADGLCFGANKPKSTRKPTMTLYKKGKDSDD